MTTKTTRWQFSADMTAPLICMLIILAGIVALYWVTNGGNSRTGGPTIVRYVDESQIPAMELGNHGDVSFMGKLFPHIIVDGAKLDYSPELDWYVHTNGGPKAFWQLKTSGADIDRQLAVTDRPQSGESLLEATRAVKMEAWNPARGRWESSQDFEPAVTPPRPVEDAGGKKILIRNHGGAISVVPVDEPAAE